MSEPSAVAATVENVVSDVWRWHLWDDRIDCESDAHAVTTGTGTVLIDPLPLRASAFARFAPVLAICLTASCHQRSAWRYRKACGAHVYAPEGATGMDEEPDARYRPEEVLPGGLKAIHTPGPDRAHYAFWREQSPSILFCADLMMREGSGELIFLPSEYQEDPEATRQSIRRLLSLPFDVLCLDHGAPITNDPHAALRALLG